MACELISLEKQSCMNPVGGILISYAASLADIDDISFDSSGVVTGFTMAGAGAFAKYEYTQDDTAYYNQTGAREGNLLSYTQEAFFKLLSITDENQEFAKALEECCDLVLVHFLRVGVRMVQGVEYDSKNQVWLPARNTTKPLLNIMSGTSAEESRVEVTFESIASHSSPLTDLDEDAMDALAGIV